MARSWRDHGEIARWPNGNDGQIMANLCELKLFETTLHESILRTTGEHSLHGGIVVTRNLKSRTCQPWSPDVNRHDQHKKFQGIYMQGQFLNVTRKCEDDVFVEARGTASM